MGVRGENLEDANNLVNDLTDGMKELMKTNRTRNNIAIKEFRKVKRSAII